MSLLNQRKEQLLDEQAVTGTKLQQAQSSLKIGSDTVFGTPVDVFGTKMLTKLGWQEGFGIGKDNSKPTSAIEYIPRQYRLGLGAVPLSKQDATGRAKAVTKDYEQSSIGRNIKRIDEALTEKSVFTVGANVTIISGPHADLVGEIVAMPKSKGVMGDLNEQD